MNRTLLSLAVFLIVVAALLYLAPPRHQELPPQPFPLTDSVSELPPTDTTAIDVTGEPAERREAGRWVRIFVLDRRPGELFVRYPGKSVTFNEWLPASEVRVLAEDEDVRQNGWTADVRHGEAWRPARLLKRNGTLYYVHYIGESAGFDEWVSARQLRSVPR